jgi:signal peptidase I
MMPTLLTGDFILVNKFSYGLRLPVLRTKILDTGAPERGDVVVFRYPVDPTQDYIKRVVGLPGDEISYHGHELRVNGELVASTPTGTYAGQGSGREMTGAEVLTESLGGVQHRVLQWPLAPYARRPGDGTWRVPEGHYFMMGDNRDNSTDSRVKSAVGFVPLENFIGRAEIIFFSAAVDEPDALRWWAPWTWPFDIRWNRFFQLVR